MTESASSTIAADRKQPWGFWATSGWGLLLGLIFLAIQLTIAWRFLAVEKEVKGSADLLAAARRLNQDGYFLCLSMAIIYPVGTVLTLALIKLRRGLSVRDYLELRPFQQLSLMVWLAAALATVALYAGIARYFPSVAQPQILTTLYESARMPALFWVTVVILMPLFEEIFFRGFLVAGWSGSMLGAIGTTIATSLIWTAVYLPLGRLELGFIFLLGLLLGAARLQTRSLYVPLSMHGLISLVIAWRLALERG